MVLCMAVHENLVRRLKPHTTRRLQFKYAELYFALETFILILTYCSAPTDLYRMFRWQCAGREAQPSQEAPLLGEKDFQFLTSSLSFLRYVIALCRDIMPRALPAPPSGRIVL